MYLTPAEAAEKLKVAPCTVLRELRAGRMPGRKVGRLWRVDWLAWQAAGAKCDWRAGRTDVLGIFGRSEPCK